MLLRALAPLALLANVAVAEVTVYGQIPLGHMTSSATATTTGRATDYTGLPAYDPTVLAPPALPNPKPSQNFFLGLQATADQVPGLSIPQHGAFFGFSIEFSVINQVIGKSSTYLMVPFLNLMSNLAQRGGRVHIRVGGNTQETAVLVDSIEDGRILEKDKSRSYATTQTPPLVYTAEVFHMLANVSSNVNIKWYLGIPFNDTKELRLGIVTVGEAILGDSLLSFQAGNEPDLYAGHQKRQSTYNEWDYFGEFGELIEKYQGTNSKKGLIAPSVATGDWTPERVWDTGFLPAYADHLDAIAVEHYPDANCFERFGVGSARDIPTVFFNYLNHTSGRALAQPYLNSSRIAQEMGKPFLMFETNTASCGGFPGISDSFGAALWAYDYALQLAHSNFSGALFHVGGQNVYYNPFTAPPTNQSTFNQWTVGPIYYSALAMAETFGTSNTSRIIDLNANYDNIFTPAYAVYENDKLARAVVFNFMTDASGQSDSSVTFQAPGVGDTIYVKYLRAESVSSKGRAISWGNQTFGSAFESDGRPMGQLDIKTFSCNTADGTCTITVPAPSAALVFFSKDAMGSSGAEASATATFATTARTRSRNTATIQPDALATSNGMNGKTRQRDGSTSHGSANGAGRAAVAHAGAVLLAALGTGAAFFA